ncbi:hypothetical protein [Pseudorhodoferax sp. Leaf267]|uniref:hypothetical protein n=1 Tax=Pseudorhodoferax sp. Leaf267 TaxID=1736316 RepID=UPI0012E199B6|nr:hypothetical protein [Pseudorhodoferax sp. Leaf267]
MLRITALLLTCLWAGMACAQVDDPLQSPACLAARERLDAAQGQGMTPQRRALRQEVANACLRAQADPPRPARLARPAEAVPSTIAPPPQVATPSALPSPTAPPAPQPAQVTRCDAGGCWDNNGQRLNRSGNQLVNPQGQFCTQQGTVLVCP